MIIKNYIVNYSKVKNKLTQEYKKFQNKFNGMEKNVTKVELFSLTL